MTHEQAKKELQAGTPAELICATCPWDRLCIEPPAMSEKDIDRQVADAKKADEENRLRDPESYKMPVGSLLTAIMLGGRDSAGRLCPVFALRLRGPDGRQLADGIRTSMRSWGEPS